MESIMRPLKKGITTFVVWTAAILIGIMASLVIWQVFTRYVLNNPASWTEELVTYFLIWSGFLAGTYAFATRQHMALLIVRDRFPERQRRLLMAFIDLLILLFALFVIVWGGSRLALSAAAELSALLGVSRGLVYAVAPISGVLIGIIQLINIWEDVTGNVLSEEKEEETL